MTWQTVYRSTDQTIEQQITGSGESAVVEERVTWHRDTPERLIERLRGQVTDLQDNATGTITEAELAAKIATRETQDGN
jgi:hypothetical protein